MARVLAPGIATLVAGMPARFLIAGCLAIATLLNLAVPAARAATPPNTPVVNVATASYTVAGKSLSVIATSAVNTSGRTAAAIQLLGVVPAGSANAQVGNLTASACQTAAGAWQPQGSLLTAYAGQISTPASLNLVNANTFSGRDVAVIAVTDPDQNIDALIAEKVSVDVTSGNDRETLQLTESGPATGVFIGFVQLTRQGSAAGDCQLGVVANDLIRTRYIDPRDSEDVVTTAALIDPFGTVFNSLTGEPVNGARVTIIDATTGLPAAVQGDDGVSSYPSTVISGQNVTDSSGQVYVMATGRYRFPQLRPGQYRIQVDPPDGFIFPSSASESSVKKLLGGSFSLALGAKGETFAIAAGPPVKLDVPIDPRTGRLLLSKSARRAQASIGEFIRYELVLRNADQNRIQNIAIDDRLPRGLRYGPGSARDSTGRSLEVQVDPSGRSIRIGIGALEAGASLTLSYVVEVTAATPLAPAVNEAVASGQGASSSPATATVQIIDDMLLSRAILVGTVHDGACPREEGAAPPKGLPKARILLQDGRYVITDEQGKWHIEGVQPGTNMVRLDTLSLPKGYRVEPCAPDPRRSMGHAARTIDVKPGSLNRVDFYTVGAARTEAAPVTPVKPLTPAASAAEAIEAAEQAAVARDDPAPAWAYPAQGHVPPQGYQSLMISHGPGQRIVLEHQGKPVPGFHFEGTKVSPQGRVLTSLWRNIHLENGENRFVARIHDRDDRLVATLERTLILATAPVRAELVPERSILVANGRDAPVIAVRFLDVRDQPVRPDITGDFSIAAPHVLKESADAVTRNPLAAQTASAPRYVVGRDGIALIALAPTTAGGEVDLRFNFEGSRLQSLKAWLQAEQREWIVVGFAEGSPMSQKLRSQLQANSGMTLDAAEIKGQRLALYAKGMISGQALMTIAYDSNKPPSSVAAGLQGVAVAPFYTVYADRSQGGLETPSWGKLYLKIEKDTFMAMLGNTTTGLGQTELGRYVRSMYGLKSSWQGDKLSYTAFAMKNLTSFHRDVFRADGTTGSWQLARGSIVPQTERVRVLVRDRLDAGHILSERVMTRTIDYTLDYASGLFLLAQPLASFDLALNPVTIEVEYSSDNLASNSQTLGGRAAFKPDTASEVGVTLIQDNDQVRGGHLAAVDARVKLTPTTEVRVEAGTSSRQDATPSGQANAFMAEIRRETPDMSARAWFRRAATGYGLNEQPISSADLQTLGADVRMKLSQDWRIEGQISHQERLSTGQIADVVQARATYSAQPWQASIGLRAGRENDGKGNASGIGQVLGSVGYLAPDQKWSLRAGAEVGASHGQALFPNRLVLEADYRISPKISLMANQSWTFADTRSSALSAGLRVQPWEGGEVQTGLSHRTWADGDNTAARLSLVQTTRLDQRWTINAQVSGARRVAGNPFANAASAINLMTPAASASGASSATPAAAAAASAASAAGTAALDDFTSAGFTLSYAKAPLSGFVRLERRWATDGRYSLAGGVSYQVDEGEHLLITARIERFSGDLRPSAAVALAHAMRREGSRWTLLQRLDYIDNNRSNAAVSAVGRRLLFSSHWNYLGTDGLEWLNHLGVKKVLEDIDGQPYGSRFAVVGSELRKPVSELFDVGVQATYAASLSSGLSNTGVGLSVGFKPADNFLVTVGYNFRGIKDSDFYAGNQRAQGLFLWTRALFDERLLGLGSTLAKAMSQGPRP